MSMEDLMKAILGGSGVKPTGSGRQSAQSDPMSDLIGAILGGGQAQQSQQDQSAGGLGDILGSILGGAQSQQSQQPQAGGDLADILGSILGGGKPQAQPRQQQSPGSIEDFLGGITGQAPMQNNSFLGPIVEKLAKSLGLPPIVAQMIVSFALSKLMPSAASGSGGGGIIPQPQRKVQPSYVPSPSRAPAQTQDGWNLDSLLDTMGSEGANSSNFIQQSGMSRELAEQMGMDESMATDSLQQVFKMLQGALSQAQTQGTRSRPSSAAPTRRSAKKINRGQY